MVDDSSFDIAISALRLAVQDAVHFPDVKNVGENRRLFSTSLELAKNETKTSKGDQNKTRIILILNRAVVTYLSRKIPTSVELKRDLDTLLRALKGPGLSEADGSVALDILSYFSEVAREYCLANPFDLKYSDADPALESLRQMCAENAEKLVYRSLLQKMASEAGQSVAD